VRFVVVVAEIGQFQKIVGGLIELVDELAKEAETEKMKVGDALDVLRGAVVTGLVSWASGSVGKAELR